MRNVTIKSNTYAYVIIDNEIILTPAQEEPAIIDVDGVSLSGLKVLKTLGQANNIIISSVDLEYIISKIDSSTGGGVSGVSSVNGKTGVVTLIGTDISGVATLVNGVIPVDQLPEISVSYNDLTNKPTLGTASSKNVGTSSGNIPVLDTNGKLVTSILPTLAITNTFVVATEAEMLALNVEVGDIAVRTDLTKTFILKDSDSSLVASWQELLNPTSEVQSVAGRVGNVVLTKTDVGLNLVDNTADVNKNVSSATKLSTPRAINGTNFDGTGPITTSTWGTARNITIGNSTKSVNGSATVSYTLSEIGALPTTGGTVSGNLSVTGNTALTTPLPLTSGGTGVTTLQAFKDTLGIPQFIQITLADYNLLTTEQKNDPTKLYLIIG